jgi:RNA 2',3'-cyclic 3'-phosphodiesterase
LVSGTNLNTRRLFFALWPEEAVREALAHATRKAVKASGGRPIPVENLHSTLLFIGPVPVDKVADLEAAADRVAPAQFTLVLDAIEHWRKAGVLCATASETPEAARQLAVDLLTRVARAGITPDVKPFRAHVTVARKVARPHVVGPMTPVSWENRGFTLVESQTLPEGSRYTVVRRW